MKRKIDIDDLELVVNGVLKDDPAAADKVIEAVKKELSEQQDDEEKEARQKYENILLRIPTDSQEEDSEYLHFLVKIKEGEDFSRIPEALLSAATDHNICAKKESKKVNNLVEAIERVARSKFKDNPVMFVNVTTKEPLLPVFCENKPIPTSSNNA